MRDLYKPRPIRALAELVALEDTASFTPAEWTAWEVCCRQRQRERHDPKKAVIDAARREFLLVTEQAPARTGGPKRAAKHRAPGKNPAWDCPTCGRRRCTVGPHRGRCLTCEPRRCKKCKAPFDRTGSLCPSCLGRDRRAQARKGKKPRRSPKAVRR